jgi:hypothetical protein
LTSHVRRYHKHYGSSGHVWQGRFKSFPVQRDEHLLMVLRYVLQNRGEEVERIVAGLFKFEAGLVAKMKDVLYK